MKVAIIGSRNFIDNFIFDAPVNANSFEYIASLLMSLYNARFIGPDALPNIETILGRFWFEFPKSDMAVLNPAFTDPRTGSSMFI